jgi:hypothetical protein
MEKAKFSEVVGSRTWKVAKSGDWWNPTSPSKDCGNRLFDDGETSNTIPARSAACCGMQYDERFFLLFRGKLKIALDRCPKDGTVASGRSA